MGETDMAADHPGIQRRPARYLLKDDAAVDIIEFGHGHLRIDKELKIPPIYDLSPQITLRRGSDLLNDLDHHGLENRPWWIGVGTALGFAREHDFIKWDTDIDVRMLLDYRDVDAALDYSRQITTLFEEYGFKLVRVFYWQHRPMQVAFADTRNNNLIFDIYFFYEGAKDGYLVHYIDTSYREKPRQFIDQLQSRPWPTDSTIQVNVPSPVEDYCAWRFGPNWRTPLSDLSERIEQESCLQPLPVITALTYGTFDGFHYGHLRILERAAAFSDRLVVGIVSDDLCKIKGKNLMLNEEQRAAVIEALSCVDEVFIQRQMNQKEIDIERFDANYFVAGDDWRDHPRIEQIRNYRGCEIVYLERTPQISSTKIRRKLLAGKSWWSRIRGKV